MKTLVDSLTKHFSFHLPENLIAQQPASPRDRSRLMIIDRKQSSISHHTFYELPNLIPQNALLVFNDTKVFPARLSGKKITGGKVELLLLHPTQNGRWEAICTPGLQKDSLINFENEKTIIVYAHHGRSIEIQPLHTSIEEIMYEFGDTPLPPYIKHNTMTRDELRTAYQTVYSREQGSAAAPTAGLHFTSEVLSNLVKRGIECANITLHVGLGTFATLREEQVQNKKLHSEHIVIGEQSTFQINRALEQNRPIIAVGTTTLRTLESSVQENGRIRPITSKTELFILPPHKFKIASGLITNFHLPHSSLLMLVSAFCSYPNTLEHFTSFEKSILGKAYIEAIEKHYRFFSFGDASLIL